MPFLKAKKPFSWAHQHVNVKEYVKGDVIETDDVDLIQVSVKEGWAAELKTPPQDDEAVKETPAHASEPLDQ